MAANMTESADMTAPDERGSPAPGARSALLLLLAINLFNYIDRQVLAAVVPEIKRHLFPTTLGQVHLIMQGLAAQGAAPAGVPVGALALTAGAAGVTESDAFALPREREVAGLRMGLLSSAFLITYMVVAPLFGWLAERTSRWLLVAVGVAVWSLASGASGVDWPVGLATAYWLLLLTRCFVGVGEGAYGPVAPAMISDLYPVKVRGSVMAWFYAAIPVGSALGYVLGGVVKGSALGWRWAFFLVVPPGLFLAVLCFFMRDPKRGQADPGAASPSRAAGWREYLGLLRIPSYVLNTLGMTAMTFALGGLAYWMSTFLKQRAERGEQTDLGPLGGTELFGVLIVVSGLFATLAGGIAGDRLRPRFPGSYFLVSGVAMIVAFPLILLVLWTPFPAAWVFLFLAVFCLFFNTGPTNTILANVTHPSIRASAFAFNILIIHALGDVISPPVIGYIQGRASLNVAFAFVSVLVLVGGIIWLWGARHLARDTARAPLSLGPDRADP